MVVGCSLSLLLHPACMKPIHGIAFTSLDAVAVLSVGHYFPSPASALGIYLWVNNLSFAGAAKVVHLRDLLQARLRKGLGKVAHKAVAGTLTSMYQRNRYEIYLLRLLLCRCGNSRFGRIWLALFVGVVCKVLRRGLVIPTLRKMFTPSDIVCQRIARRVHVERETMRSPTSRAGVAAVASGVALKLVLKIIHVKNKAFVSLLI